MSTDATTATARPVRSIGPATGGSDAEAERAALYRRRVEGLRLRYRRRACRNGLAANGVSLLLVAAGAAVGLAPLLAASPSVTVVLGVGVILLEGVTRVLRPALRATRARWVTRRLDREFRLYDARGRGYGGDDPDAAFVVAVERILERADAAEEHDDSGTSTEPTGAARKAA